MTLTIFVSIVAIHLAAAISPGPSFVVAVRVSAAEGFRAAAALAFGFGLGAALWAVAAMTGLALLFELMPQIFAALKLIGAAFLLFIAVMMWRHASEPLERADPGIAPRSAASAIRYGFTVFATNPKTAVFFGAVFVGLLPPDTSLAARAALIAAIFANETLWYLVVARAFSLPRPREAYIRAKAFVDRAFGTLIAGFGLKIALD